MNLSDEQLKRSIPAGFMSDDFAVVLGLKESAYGGRAPRDEIEKLNFLQVYIHRNKMEHEEQQEVFLARFCALYLPATVSHFLNPPSIAGVSADPEVIACFNLYNAYLEMIVQIQHSPYFSKYLRSNKAIAADGKRLPRVLAERLLEHAPRLDRLMLAGPNESTTYESIAGSCVQLLSTLLTAFVKVTKQETVVPMETRRGLLPWLVKWSQRNAGRGTDPFFGDVCMRTWAQLSQKIDIKNETKQVRRMFKNLEVCALPLCENKTNNKACGKCQTVCYCCPEHQRAHWTFPFGAQHKQLCHKTEY